MSDDPPRWDHVWMVDTDEGPRRHVLRNDTRTPEWMAEHAGPVRFGFGELRGDGRYVGSHEIRAAS